MRERSRGQPTVDLVERAAGTHRGERGRERTARGRGVVHVVGRDHLDTGLQRDLRERVVAVPVERIAVIPQLHEHAVAAERVDQLAQRPLGRGGTVALQRGGHAPLATTREHEPVVVLAGGDVAGEVHGRPRRVGEVRERRARRALLARELRLADRLGQPRVPDRALREHDQMLTRRIGHPVRELLRAERQLGAEDGREIDRAGGFGEADHAVEAVVVGDAPAPRARAAPLPRPAPRDGSHRRGTRSSNGSAARRTPVYWSTPAPLLSGARRLPHYRLQHGAMYHVTRLDPGVAICVSVC